ncbi:MAG TPA: PaaI family thioesterase [Trebonia sp.]|jgi:uncharacterized protein (TIGR00369 family)|nr:PaaI family thioesterase [Trebonia sp.]
MTMTERTGPEQELLVLESGPELIFRVTRPATEGEAVFSSMPVGPWLNGPSGRPLAGALGVLIDNVLSYAIMLRRPPGGWSVSAEISVDLCGPVPDGPHVLIAEGHSDHSDGAGGIASGSVTDGAGRLIALCRQHGRWISSTPRAASAEAAGSVAVPGDLTGVLGAPCTAADGSVHLDLAVTRDLANPLGTLHGGITLCACDLVAQAALAAVGGQSRTRSIRVAYTRPVLAATAVRFEGRVLHRGRAFAVTQVTALNDRGKPCVIATVTTGAPA